jgi:SlyX protein
MEAGMSDERLVELESRLAYQEDTLQVLNGVVTRQQKQIEQLEAACRTLLERLSKTSEVHRGTADEEVPPHY